MLGISLSEGRKEGTEGISPDEGTGGPHCILWEVSYCASVLFWHMLGSQRAEITSLNSVCSRLKFLGPRRGPKMLVRSLLETRAQPPPPTERGSSGLAHHIS